MADSRSALVYADFVLPHLSPAARVVDIGCGDGELSIELAGHVGRITGVDSDLDTIAVARATAEAAGVRNAEFAVGDAYQVDLPTGSTDVVFAHSVLEALARPIDALAEMRRLLRPGGLVAVASVEYDGLILGGPRPDLVRRFYDLREQLWLLDGADPYVGRNLRGLLATAGFCDVTATSTYVSYGTPAAVREFGRGRADECAVGEWFSGAAQEHELASPADLESMRAAWLEWAESPASYAAFAWCRALGRSPDGVAAVAEA